MSEIFPVLYTLASHGRMGTVFKKKKTTHKQNPCVSVDVEVVMLMQYIFM